MHKKENAAKKETTPNARFFPAVSPSFEKGRFHFFIGKRHFYSYLD